MLTYHIDKRGKTPIYLYLYECIKADIEKGAIAAKEKLPSRRSLAEHLQISVTTVQYAYGQLVSEGYIYSKPKSGFFVRPLDTLRYPPGEKNVPKAPEEKEKPALLADFRDNSIDADQFPFSAWAGVIRKVLYEYGGETQKRMPSKGVYRLRNAISGFLYRFRGIEVSPERIVIGAGAEHLYGFLVKLLGKDKIYAAEDPGYAKITAVYQSEGVKIRHIPLDNWGLSAKKLRESDACIAHISPAHHFPTGIVMPAARRREILNWAYESPERYIIEDDYDSEFRFTGKPIPTLESTDTEGRVIYLNTFSKTISPSLRIGYMVLPDGLLERYEKTLGFYACAVSGIDQYALAKFMDDGFLERHINRMRKTYKQARDSVIQIIKESPLGNAADILEKDSGLHFIIKLKTRLKDEDIIREAAKKGVGIDCLSQFCHGAKSGESHKFIVNYSGIKPEAARKAAEILSHILQNAPQTGESLSGKNTKNIL